MEFLNFIPCVKYFAYNIFGLTFVLFLHLIGPEIDIKFFVFWYRTHIEFFEEKNYGSYFCKLGIPTRTKRLKKTRIVSKKIVS